MTFFQSWLNVDLQSLLDDGRRPPGPAQPVNMSANFFAERACKYIYLKSFDGAVGLLEILV